STSIAERENPLRCPDIERFLPGQFEAFADRSTSLSPLKETSRQTRRTNRLLKAATLVTHFRTNKMINNIRRTVPGLWLALAFVFLTCSSSATAQSNQPPADNGYIEGAVLWQQSSGERRALSYQAFALAHMMLDRDLRMNRRLRKPRAAIVDLDETILDNGLNEGMQVRNHISFNQK